jgi:hypothetical protein
MTPADLKESFNKAKGLIKRDGIDSLVLWLETETDFFKAPASTLYHGNYEGGLLEHSLNVTRFALHNFNFIVKEKPDLEYLRESVLICGLFHDVCKINYYEPQIKWTKDNQGKWKSYSGWIVKDKFPLGHGEKSVYLISKYLELTNAEAMAIRWHMGATEPSIVIPNNAQYYAYYDAIDHPLVRLIHCADMLSMTIEEVKDLKNL